MSAPAGASEPPIVSEDSGPLDDHEVTLWTCKEMYVYQIPPLKSESGHRANDWNVDKWLWSGRLRVVSCGALLKVILEDATSGELFATCPCKDPHSKAVDPVVDSSRYFVLRIESGDGKHAFIGMGFRDRNESYDFNATLQDHWRSVEREKEAAELEAKLAAQPLKDLSLKEGEKMSINVPGRKAGAERPARPRGEGGLTPAAAGRRPPRAAAARRRRRREAGARARARAAPAPAPAAPATAAADDDFGDFSGGGGGGADDDDFGDFSSG